MDEKTVEEMFKAQMKGEEDQGRYTRHETSSVIITRQLRETPLTSTKRRD